MKWKRADVVELGGVALAAGALASFGARHAGRVAVGEVVLAAAVWILLQGLVRDVASLVAMRRRAARAETAPVACMCVESTVGVSALVAAALLLFSPAARSVPMGGFAWGALFGALGLAGWRTKDLVLDLRARRVRRGGAHDAIRLG